MHPIKVLYQVIVKVLKLIYSSSQLSHLPPSKSLTFFSHQRHQVFVLLHGEQTGRKSES